MHLFNKVLRDESGATVIEYGLIAGLIVIAIIVAVSDVADANTGMWAFVSGSITGATT